MSPAPLRLLAGILLTLPALPALATEPTPVEITTEDGYLLSGEWFPADGEARGAVLWLHQPGRSGNDYHYIAGQLADSGYAGLTIDLRGHGESLLGPAGPVDRDDFEAADYAGMLADVQAAVDFIGEREGDVRLHLVGADFGATLALYHAAENPDVGNLILLSPGLYYQDLNLVGKVRAYGARPLLMVYSAEDNYASRSVDRLSQEIEGPHLIQPYLGAGHGVRMLSRAAGLELLLNEWIMGVDSREVDYAAGLAGLVEQDKGEVEDGVDIADQERRLQEQEADARAREEEVRQQEVDTSQDGGRWDTERDENEQ